ncbi:glycosyltransferase [Wenyingzhuangia sp. IMCC45533]
MIILALYFIIILATIIGLSKLPKLKIDTSLTPHLFSVVIPFRNEACNLDKLLKSIADLNYPSQCFEILLVDDESTDDSVNIIKQWQTTIPNLTILKNDRLSNSPKKDAIKVGIANASFDWIITTDADCMLPKKWLHAYNSKIAKDNSLFIAGPIQIIAKNKWIEQYQKLETISLLGTTAGTFGLKAPMMCNAANMGFAKRAFLKVEELSNHRIASGDDIFTLEYFAKTYPEQTHYLNTENAVVTTYAEKTWNQVIQQRVRWAAKSVHYKNVLTKIFGLVVFIIQIRIVTGLLLMPLSTSFIWITKTGLDFCLILLTTYYFKQKINFIYFIASALLYPFLNTYIGIKALIGGYQWKNRTFKR